MGKQTNIGKGTSNSADDRGIEQMANAASFEESTRTRVNRDLDELRVIVDEKTRQVTIVVIVSIILLIVMLVWSAYSQSKAVRASAAAQNAIIEKAREIETSRQRVSEFVKQIEEKKGDLDAAIAKAESAKSIIETRLGEATVKIDQVAADVKTRQAAIDASLNDAKKASHDLTVAIEGQAQLKTWLEGYKSELAKVLVEAKKPRP